jgi:putative oxidoreductase
MKTPLRELQPHIYALMRMIVGFLVLWHGTEKLFSFPVAPKQVAPFMLYVAGSIDLIGGVLVMVGLFAGWAALILSGLKFLTYWMFHGTNALLPMQNGGELSALYCVIFLYIATEGSGVWSVEAALGKTPKVV